MSSYNDSTGYSSDPRTPALEDDGQSTFSEDIDIDQFSEGDNSREVISTGRTIPSVQSPGASSYTRASAGHMAASSTAASEVETGSYYDYTSGYGSMTYDESSPRSPRSDELSSTFASFFFESERVGKVVQTINFLRRPALFLTASAVGSSALSAVVRVVHMYTRKVGSPPASAADISPVSFDHTDVAPWLRAARAAVPAVVERPLAWFLRKRGVPVMSDLQVAAEGAARRITQGVQEAAQECWDHSGPMLPAILFLPAFSALALWVSRSIIAKQTRRNTLDFFSPVNRDGAVELQGMRMTALDEDSRNLSLDADPSQPHSYLRNDTGDDASADQTPLLHAVPHLGALDAPRRKQDELLDGDDALLPLTTREAGNGAGAFTTSGKLSGAGNAIYMDTPRTMPAESRALSPRVDAGAMDEAQKPAPAPFTSVSDAVLVERYHFQGRVMAAAVGEVTLTGANRLLIAAVTYGCERILLPYALTSVGLAAVPPSVTIELVPHVIQQVSRYAREMQLTVVGVHERQITSDAVSISSFVHPLNAIYVFASGLEGEDESVVAAADVMIFTEGEGGADGTAPNQCFYDRMAKERTA